MLGVDIIRCFVKNYIFSYNKIKDNIKICLISDIHFSKIFNVNNLNRITNKINIIKPNYVVIAGDLIDQLDITLDDKINYFYDWLNDLGNSYKVIVIFGNHDYYIKNNKLDYNKLYNKFYDKLLTLNINLLDNNVYEDKNVRFVGFNMQYNSLEYELEIFNKLDMNLFIGKKNKVNIAVIHNPINVINEDVRNILNNFDIIMSGHMHNGLMFSFVDLLFKGNNGIIAPNKKFFPRISRNMIKLDKDKYLIISGGITKLSYSSKIFRFGNFLYPMEIDNILINKKIKK